MNKIGNSIFNINFYGSVKWKSVDSGDYYFYFWKACDGVVVLANDVKINN